MTGATHSSYRIVSLLIRAALSSLFVYSAAVKLLDIVPFADHVGDFGIVADSLVPASAWVIICVEMGLGVGLLCGSRLCLVGIAILLVGYLLVLVYGIATGLDVECGCLGSGIPVSMPTQIMMDVVLLSLVMVVAIFDLGVSDVVDVKRTWFGRRGVRNRDDDDFVGRMRDESISAGTADRRVGDQAE